MKSILFLQLGVSVTIDNRCHVFWCYIWYVKFTVQYLLSSLFFCVIPYYLNKAFLHRWCVPSLWKFLMIHVVAISFCVVHSILLWYVVWYSLITSLKTFFFTRAIAITISLCFTIHCLRFFSISSVVPFSLACALSIEIMWATCNYLAHVLMSLNVFFPLIHILQFPRQW